MRRSPTPRPGHIDGVRRTRARRRPNVALPYTERHTLLEEIFLGAPSGVEVVASFDDGPALWDAIVARGLEGIVARGLEGVVAKREREPYRPGARCG